MAYRLPSHLHRNRHGVLYLRLRIPTHLQPLLGQREVYRSLGTASVRQAARVAETLRTAFYAIFDAAPMSDTSDSKNSSQTLDVHALRSVTRIQKRLMAEQERREQAEAEANELYRRAAKLEAQAATDKAVASSLRQKIDSVRAEGDAESATLRTALAREEGKVAGLTLALGTPMPQPVVTSTPANAPLSLKTAASDYLEKRLPELGKSYATISAYTTQLSKFWEIIGTKTDVFSIGQVQFEDISRKFIKKHKNLSDTTINNSIITLAAFLNDTQRHTGRPKIETQGVLIKKKKQFEDHTSRAPFTLDQQKAILAQALNEFSDRPHLYWSTLLAMLTGARVGEIAGFEFDQDITSKSTASDFKIHYLRVVGKLVGRKLKTDSSKRNIPLHPTLLEFGFLNYINESKARGINTFADAFQIKKRTRSDKKRTDRDWSSPLTKAGTQQLKKIRENTPELDWAKKQSYWHSQRHSFVDLSRKALAPTHFTTLVTGHSTSSPESGAIKNYGDAAGDIETLYEKVILPTLGPLIEAINELRPPRPEGNDCPPAT